MELKSSPVGTRDPDSYTNPHTPGWITLKKEKFVFLFLYTLVSLSFEKQGDWELYRKVHSIVLSLVSTS